MNEPTLESRLEPPTTLDPWHSGITYAEMFYLGEYIRLVADLMGLRDWRITLCPSPTNDILRELEKVPYIAFIDPAHSMQRTADLWFSAYWLRGQTRLEQRQSIVHELLHLHHFKEEMIIHDLGESLEGGWAAHEILQKWWTQANEEAIEATADIITAYMPDLEWPSPLEDDGTICEDSIVLAPRGAYLRPPSFEALQQEYRARQLEEDLDIDAKVEVPA
jgi:hypothetical protein